MIEQPYVVATLKGLVEAATEFLPVSSTGHLFLMNAWMQFVGDQFAAPKGSDVDFMDFFDIFIQFGAILAVVVEYRRNLWSRFTLALQKTPEGEAAPPPGGETGPMPPPSEAIPTNEAATPAGSQAAPDVIATPLQARRFWLALIVGTIPVLGVGFAFKGFLNGIEHNPYILLILAGAWIVGGAIMWVNELRAPAVTQPSAWNIDLKTAVYVGLFQCVAMWPGISRSAATIIAGRRLGLSKQAAAEFSFFLAVPALTAASLYKLWKAHAMLNNPEIFGVLAVGTLLSFIGAWLVIRLFLAFLRKFSFVSFAIYRILLGLAVLGAYWGGWRMGH